MQAHGLHWSLKLGSLHSKEQQWPKKPDLASMQPPAHIKPMVMEEVSDDEQKSDGRYVYYRERENLTALKVPTHSPLVLMVKVG